MDQREFEAACGVGVVITPEQIEDAVRTLHLQMFTKVFPWCEYRLDIIGGGQIW